MGKERQGQRPKRLQAFVDGEGEEKEGAKQSWPLVCLAPALPVIRARVPHLFRESLRGDSRTNLHPRIQVGLFVAYPEYWLLSTERRHHQYPSLVRFICYPDRELADSEERALEHRRRCGYTTEA